MSGIEAGQKISIPFSTVQVLDVRFDRTNIGCVGNILKANNSVVKSRQTVAVFPDSLRTYLPQILQELFQFQKDANDTLVLLVKQFRLAERTVNALNMHYEPALTLKVSLSAFALKDANLTKLFSVDDLLSKKFPSDLKPTNEFFFELRAYAMMSMLQSIFQNRRWEPNGPSFSMSTVQESIRKRYQLPLFNDTVLRAGVYKSFYEFKQNQPSHTDARFVMLKGKVVAVRDNENKTIDLKTIWGVCNGKTQYIVFRGKLCELLPSDKSFYFLSNSQMKGSPSPSHGDFESQAVVLGAQMLKSMIFDGTTNKDYFYLNMDEEIVYLEDLLGKSGSKEVQKDRLK